MSRNHDQCDGCTDRLRNADAMPARSTLIPNTIEGKVKRSEQIAEASGCTLSSSISVHILEHRSTS
jgi:hypothetical protein